MADTKNKKKTAGALDIRNIIGALMAVYGIILLLMGLFADPETEKTGGVNANLWAGLALLAVGGLFLTWARLRPVIVPPDLHQDHEEIMRANLGDAAVHRPEHEHGEAGHPGDRKAPGTTGSHEAH